MSRSTYAWIPPPGSSRTASNVTTDQIREAHAILGDGLVTVQNQHSPGVRDREPQLRLRTELAWRSSPGASSAASPGAPSKDAPARPPGATAFQRAAAARGVSPQQISLAWLLTPLVSLIPVPRASRPAPRTHSAGAADRRLSEDEQARLNGELPHQDPNLRAGGTSSAVRASSRMAGPTRHRRTNICTA
ncbi:aldo/keto reductase [Streptomyces sp. NPDC053429]|uniref:aldo/keto reductase n=1 Tax=Streptomyces sp. NPDC053429 TaxID=3365702 RepID=UPI0037CD440D